MASENIFIEHEKWNHYAHPATTLRDLKHQGHSSSIRLYFTQKNLSASLVRQLSNAQLAKAEGLLKSPKIKAIFKEKARREQRRKGQAQPKLELEVKFSSRTNVCDEEEQEVSQYLNIWEEGELIV
jgi:hypothetical protein